MKTMAMYIIRRYATRPIPAKLDEPIEVTITAAMTWYRAAILSWKAARGQI